MSPATARGWDVTRIHCLTVKEALASLQSRPSGLTGDEARRRLGEFGPNRVEQVRDEPLAVRFSKSFTHFFALILWMAAGLAFFAEWNDPGKGMAALGIAILGVILINGLFSFWQEYRAEQAIAALRRLLPHQVQAWRDGKLVQVPVEVLVPGDLIVLQGGDHIPADCRLIRAFGVRVDTSTITGESIPKVRDAHTSDQEEVGQSKNILLAGTALVSGEASALVFATGMQTEFGRIAHLTQAAKAPLSPLQLEILRLSRMVALLATGLGVLFFIIGQGLGFTFWQNFMFAIGIIVANVPEGLLPTVTLALAMGARRMAKRRAVIRHLPAVETLGSATVICTDKTGTLTRNRMEVRRLYLDGRFYDPTDGGAQHAAPVQQDAHRRFFETAWFCHELKTTERDGRMEVQGDPMEVALAEMARAVLSDVPDAPRVDELPFDSDRRRLSTLHRTPQGLVLYTKGALESVAAMAAFFFVLRAGGWSYGRALAWNDPLYRAATTACLSAIIVMQVVNLFLCRSERESAFAFGLFGNRLLLWGIAIELALILWIDYSAWGQWVFHTAPIAPEGWLFMLPFAAAMLVLEELRKWWRRAR